MLRNKLYYSVKPLLPWSVRRGIRRWFAVRKRQRRREVWPVLPGSERPPEGWTGWPEGRQFAFVLTHDVEGPEGLARCRKLMALEQQFGFRSSFNFIPEGDYHVPSDLRAELAGEGFEVGVHDLHHDGKLFSSRQAFRSRARRINHYLKEWNAVGFRAGFMLHHLDWQHDLEVQYDASTFDTDPFEPQPDGAGTIFPFWVPRPGSTELGTRNSKPSEFDASVPSSVLRPPSSRAGGYVELPYTLPQDSTLFLILGETTSDIWLRKLDWIARHGGMALVNVHPDYLRFDGEPAAAHTFAAAHYARLLEYVRDRHRDGCWQPLPREMATFVAGRRPLPVRRKPLRVCMLTHSFYLSDTRVMRYAEALAERGDQVEVISLRRSPELPKQERLGNVSLVRLQPRMVQEQHAGVLYLLPLLRFLLASSWWITRRHWRRRYDLLHIHNVPDFLVFAAWYPRLTGARIILDIHDIVPELYASKFGAREESRTVAALKRVERASAAFAHHVILANDLWRESYTARSAPREKCSVIINYVDRRLFSPRPRTRKDDRLILLFPGGLQWHQGLDIAIRAFQKVSRQLPQAELRIYGDGNMKPNLVALAGELGLDGKVRFFETLPVRQIVDVMANADLGVVPKRADSFGNEAYSTKIMEFMSLGVPVVVSATKIDRYYFDDSVVRFFPSGDADALAEAILEVLGNGEARRQMVTRASDYAARHSWDSRKADYLRLVDDLCAREVKTGQHSA